MCGIASVTSANCTRWTPIGVLRAVSMRRRVYICGFIALKGLTDNAESYGDTFYQSVPLLFTFRELLPGYTDAHQRLADILLKETRMLQGSMQNNGSIQNSY